MQLILSCRGKDKNLKIISSNSKMDSVDQIKEILGKVLNEIIKSGPVNDTITINNGNFVNYIFPIKSYWNKDLKDILMLTAFLDEHYNIKIFNQAFIDTIQKIQEEDEIYKSIYFDEFGDEDDEITEKYNRLVEIGKDLDVRLRKIIHKKESSLSDLIVLGIQKVGKSSLVNRLINNNFSENIRPTLSTNISKMVLEEMDLRVYDVGGQKLIRKQWKKSTINPSGVVFVIDATGDKKHHEEASTEFKNMMKYYFEDISPNKLSNTIPILIIVNKIDLLPDFDMGLVNELYQPQEFDMHYKLGMTSAFTGDGITDNFKWLSDEISRFKRDI